MLAKIISTVKINVKYLFSRLTIMASLFFAIISTFQLFIGWETIGINDDKKKILIFIVVLLLSVISSLIWVMFFSNKKVILKEDPIQLIVKYGDLMEEAFPKKIVEDRIVVIAVNCCYDTVVGHRIIKPDSIHGQFLQHYISNSSKKIELDNNIEQSLKEKQINYEELNIAAKRYGKLRRYPLGSVACIEGKNGVTFFLLALSRFDVNCVGHCNKHEFVDCLLDLFEFYNNHGQGKELYLYPMGAGMSRTGFSYKDALEATVSIAKISKDNLRAKTVIVVDKALKNEISIMDL